MNQWNAGALQPPHLAALCVWEGSCDYYRELCRHGGILSDFLNNWHPRQVGGVQHGVGDRGQEPGDGEPVAGPPTLRGCARQEPHRHAGEAKAHKFIDDYAARTAEFDKIEAPLLSPPIGAAWPAHARQFRGLARRRSKQKWLEVHGDTHFTHFYSKYGETLQKKFFGHFSRRDTGWNQQPRVSVNVRHPDESSCCARKTNGRWRARNGPSFSAPQASRWRRVSLAEPRPSATRPPATD